MEMQILSRNVDKWQRKITDKCYTLRRKKNNIEARFPELIIIFVKWYIYLFVYAIIMRFMCFVKVYFLSNLFVQHASVNNLKANGQEYDTQY